MLDAFEDDDEKAAFLEREAEIWEALRTIEGPHAVLTYQGKFSEIVNLCPMQFSYDCDHWVIGLIAE